MLTIYCPLCYLFGKHLLIRASIQILGCSSSIIVPINSVAGYPINVQYIAHGVLVC